MIYFVCKEQQAVGAELLARRFCEKYPDRTVGLFFIQPYDVFTGRVSNTNWVFPVEDVVNHANATGSYSKEVEEIVEKLPWKVISASQWLNESLGRKYHTLYGDPAAVREYLSYVVSGYLKFIDTKKPTALVDTDIDNIIRVALHICCAARGIKYISLIHSRYRDYMFWNTDYDEGLDLYNLNVFKRCELALESAEDDLVDFIDSVSLVNSEEMIFERKVFADSGVKLIRDILSYSYFSLVVWLRIKCFCLKRGKAIPKFLRVREWAALRYNVRTRLRRYSRIKNRTACNYNISDFIYFPLAYDVEGCDSYANGGFRSQLDVLNELNTCIGETESLFVRDHRAMVGERDELIARSLNARQNISYQPPENTFGDDPKRYILKCKAVVSLGGTSAIEAIALKKPAFVIGRPSYSWFFDSLGCESEDSIPDMWREFQNNPRVESRYAELLSYVGFLKQCAFSVNYTDLLRAKKTELGHNEHLSDRMLVLLRERLMG